MGQAVGRGRAFVEDEPRRSGPRGQRLFVDLLRLPEAADFGLELGKPDGSFDRPKRHVKPWQTQQILAERLRDPAKPQVDHLRRLISIGVQARARPPASL